MYLQVKEFLGTIFSLLKKELVKLKNAKVLNSYLKTVLLSFIIFVVIFFVFSFCSAGKLAEHQHKMFNDIDSLSILSKYQADEIKEDKYLSNLEPIDSFTYKIKWNKNIFYIYAYVFEDDLQCKQYISNRKIPYYGNEGYHLSGNIFFSNEYIVYSNNKLLYIEGPGEDSLMEFLDFVGQNFDIVI